jgi:7,8-dihydro-6-hydroxymethylpterin-pyrophosphokinase
VLLSHHKAKKLLEESDKYENTPLHVAAKKGFINVVKVKPVFHWANLFARTEKDAT